MTNPTDDRTNEAAEQLARAARALPREIEPPTELWAAVQQAVVARQVHTLPAHRAPGASGVGTRGWMFSASAPRWALRVAASLVIVASALALLVIARGGTTDAPAAGELMSLMAVKATPAQAAAMIASLDQYDAAAKDLTVALHAQHGALRPATIAAVERSLRTIDTAIAEARTALEKDPASGVVYELLLGMYRQKLELLKRSSVLAQS